MPGYSSPAPRTVIDVRPIDTPPDHHLARAAAGHAEIVAAITDHIAREWARHSDPTPDSLPG